MKMSFSIHSINCDALQPIVRRVVVYIMMFSGHVYQPHVQWSSVPCQNCAMQISHRYLCNTTKPHDLVTAIFNLHRIMLAGCREHEIKMYSGATANLKQRLSAHQQDLLAGEKWTTCFITLITLDVHVARTMETLQNYLIYHLANLTCCTKHIVIPNQHRNQHSRGLKQHSATKEYKLYVLVRQ